MQHYCELNTKLFYTNIQEIVLHDTWLKCSIAEQIEIKLN